MTGRTGRTRGLTSQKFPLLTVTEKCQRLHFLGRVHATTRRTPAQRHPAAHRSTAEPINPVATQTITSLVAHDKLSRCLSAEFAFAQRYANFIDTISPGS